MTKRFPHAASAGVDLIADEQGRHPEPERRAWLLVAARTAGLAWATGALAGCAGWSLGALAERWGLRSEAADPALSPELKQTLDGLYLRGARALLANDLESATAAWRQLVALSPTGWRRAQQTRGHLTLLQREAGRRFAQRAAAQERAGTAQSTNRLHVAVMPFATLGPAASPGAAAFNRAVAAMIAVDLARVPALTVLEREKVEALTQELKLSASPLVDPATALLPGRLLGAGSVVAGGVLNEAGPAGPGSGRYRINAALSEVSSARYLGQVESDGLQAEFFVLQKRVVHGILDMLGVRDRPASVDTIHTRSWEAYARFATGLSLMAQDRFVEARQAFAAALGFDPAFALAAESLLNTPERLATLQEIQDATRATVQGLPPAMRDGRP